MQDLISRIHELNRPRLLARAARAGLASYSRSRDLKRVFRGLPPCSRGEMLTRLLELESELDAQRRANRAGYCLLRHVDVLIALAAEAQVFLASKAPKHSKTAPKKAPSRLDQLQTLEAT